MRPTEAAITQMKKRMSLWFISRTRYSLFRGKDLVDHAHGIPRDDRDHSVAFEQDGIPGGREDLAAAEDQRENEAGGEFGGGEGTFSSVKIFMCISIACTLFGKSLFSRALCVCVFNRLQVSPVPAFCTVTKCPLQAQKQMLLLAECMA